MRAIRKKEREIETVYWISIIGSLFSIIYTIVVMIQGVKVTKKIDYIYNRSLREAERKWRMTLK